MVRIVDMDQTSDGGNSEHEEDDEMREEDVGNDKGLLGEGGGEGEGLHVGGRGGAGAGAVTEEEGEVEREEVDRWGVVLVGKDGLEGELV